ncbi:hypothetical protein ACFVYD_17430 [Streptomyces sp. NPDC058301]|uniref:hypothetical protein n=1 Tax=Streptomyces sp. NPDC058301 TaxID=3346436 RepID=UPI0036EA1D89
MTFMDLEDPRYAYMFGFLQADGHLAQGTGQKGRLTVEISYRDIGILEEFRRLTNGRTEDCWSSTTAPQPRKNSAGPSEAATFASGVCAPEKSPCRRR